MRRLTGAFCAAVNGRMIDRCWRLAMAALFLSSQQGCSDMAGLSWVGDRWGPSPVLVAGATASAGNRQVAVVNAMIIAANGGIIDPNAPPLVVPRPIALADWYNVVTSGFNVIDDACETYIDDLWKLDREKTSLASIITAAGAATAAIVGANGAANSSTLLILTQAFGFSGQVVTALSSNYLYTKNPSTIKGLVKKLMDQYRADFATNARTPDIASYPAAYYHMRSYLSLCLPPTIESQIEQLVTASVADTGTKPAVIAPKLIGTVPLSGPNPAPHPMGPAMMGGPVIGTSTSTRTGTGGSGLGSSGGGTGGNQSTKQSGPQTANVDSKSPPPNAQTPFEQAMTVGTVKKLQEALCITAPDGNFGTANSETREAIREFKSTEYNRSFDQQTGTISSMNDRDTLRRAVMLSPGCGMNGGPEDAFEVGAFTKFNGMSGVISRLKTSIAKAGRADPTKVPKALLDAAQPNAATGFDMRAAISFLRTRFGLSEGDKIDDKFWSKLLSDAAL